MKLGLGWLGIGMEDTSVHTNLYLFVSKMKISPLENWIVSIVKGFEALPFIPKGISRSLVVVLSESFADKLGRGVSEDSRVSPDYKRGCEITSRHASRQSPEHIGSNNLTSEVSLQYPTHALRPPF